MRMICTMTASPASTRPAAMIMERMAYCCRMVSASLRVSRDPRTIPAETGCILLVDFASLGLYLPRPIEWQAQEAQNQAQQHNPARRVGRDDSPDQLRVSPSQLCRLDLPTESPSPRFRAVWL